MDNSDGRVILDALLQAALDAARPAGRFAGRLPDPPSGRTIVVGAGKAAASMAQAFEAEWPHSLEGLVVARYGHAAKTRSIEVVEASHPMPDAAGLRAAQRILELVRSARPNDLVVALISGGASSLLSVPAPGLTLDEKRVLTSQLLRSGAPISAMNEVRKALSAIKGGRLAAACRAKLVTYVISDVPGDDPTIVGSGPTVVAKSSRLVDVRAILDRYGINAPAHVAKVIAANVAPTSVDGETHVIATAKTALDAAALAARRLGIEPLILGDAIEGEAREVGVVMAGIARSVLSCGTPAKRPCVILSGGETTVTMRGQGRGGRNTEFLLSLAMSLDGAEGVSAIAVDTDGIDGSEDNAGAWFDPTFVSSAGDSEVDLAAHLARNDAYEAFAKMNRLVMTGPTLTNVNDFRAILVQ
ncbi:glycerate kinase type-2 family protein [Bradyrhizobium vignae]|uniref:glycerate kinase type-2 family protein n=1 Tax=Bradyrhizobium vignae TaxID=1549949 RepID=UPI00100BD756|nr:glycerate kinase [Bradyrhizobium vignae]RXG93232.1 glycerate kinase [Bradyrhizobium vignae]